MIYIFNLLIVIISLLLSGCESTDPVRVEDDFGKSVRQMVDAQIYDPAAAEYPPTEPPTILEGEKAEASYDTYRESAASREDVSTPLQIQISN